MNPLYSAQIAARNAIAYSPSEIESARGFRWAAIKVYLLLSQCSDGLLQIASKIGLICPNIIANAVCPIDLLSGNRRFVFMPRFVENLIGNYAIYPLATFSLSKSLGAQATTVDQICKQILSANQALLNPDACSTQFSYRATIFGSETQNAFAVPGGAVVLYSKLIDALNHAIASGMIDSAVVGSNGEQIDLRGIQLEDALAALIGHEFAHIGARHTTAAVPINLAYAVFAFFVHFFSDGWLEAKFNVLKGLFFSRKQEYEADVAGAYLAKQAGYNPLGAIYLQEFFLRSNSDLPDFLQRNFEFLFSHPHGENRKRALYAAINIMNPPDPAAIG